MKRFKKNFKKIKEEGNHCFLGQKIRNYGNGNDAIILIIKTKK